MDKNHKVHTGDEGLNCSICKSECMSCSVERLSVNAGSDMEAKQYEYDLDEKLKHKEHDMKKASHDMKKMSHKDHEAAMTSPQMAKEMEYDMKKRFWISLILTIPIFLY